MILKIGYFFKLLFALEEDLNFRADRYFWDLKSSHYVFWNGSDNTVQKFRSPVKFDWTPFSIQIIHQHFYRGMISSPITSDSLVIVVPPGAAYTSEEKFMLPFDTTTWILFAIVFVIAFAVVGLLRIFKSPSSNSFVLGDNVRASGLNIFGAFMGIGQFALPTRSIARILLMIFLLFCLIMRTAYQGVFYNFLTTDPHKKPIRSIEELMDSKFPLYREMHTSHETDDPDDFLKK